MIRVQIDAHASLRAKSRDPRYETTDFDFPTGVWELAAIPREGDRVGISETGESWEVAWVYFGRGEELPIVSLR